MGVDSDRDEREPVLFEAREVASLLREFFDYDETPDAYTWWAWESNDTYRAIVEGRDPAEVLIDTGYWVPEDEGPFPEVLRAALIEAAS